MYYSQFGQDKHIIENIWPDKIDGYFVEVGALDGILHSNSYALEKIGWSGVCIEPDPDRFSKLCNNRRCYCTNSPLYNVDGKVIKFWCMGSLSGIDDTLNRYRHKTKKAKSIQLVTSTLDSVLDDVNAPDFIEYLSIDTEGSELQVLEGVNLRTRIFGYITVEHNKENEKREAIRCLLESSGYRHFRSHKMDDDYIHESIGGIQ